MLFVGMMKWWWTEGWLMFLRGLGDQLKNAADFFSIRLLVRNMFAPFRQISAGGASSQALSAQLSAFFDRLLSRFVGAMVRFFLLVIGTIIIIVQAVTGAIIAILWPLAPLLAVGCFVLAIMGISF